MSHSPRCSMSHSHKSDKVIKIHFGKTRLCTTMAKRANNFTTTKTSVVGILEQDAIGHIYAADPLRDLHWRQVRLWRRSWNGIISLFGIFLFFGVLFLLPRRRIRGGNWVGLCWGSRYRDRMGGASLGTTRTLD